MLPTLRSVLAVATILQLTTLVAYAQEHRSSIRGMVIDPALKGISNVQVRVSREDTGESRTVRTDEGGRFSVPELPAGVYRVNVEQPGFGPFVARAELTMNQELWLQVPLQIGSV